MADKVKLAPAAGLLSLTDGDTTTRSGEVCGVWSSVTLPVYSAPALPPENLTSRSLPLSRMSCVILPIQLPETPGTSFPAPSKTAMSGSAVPVVRIVSVPGESTRTRK